MDNLNGLLVALAATLPPLPRQTINNDLEDLIVLAEQEPHPYAVISLCDEGIRWKAESKEACEVMASILGDGAKAMPMTDFINGLKKVQEEETFNSVGLKHG